MVLAAIMDWTYKSNPSNPMGAPPMAVSERPSLLYNWQGERDLRIEVCRLRSVGPPVQEALRMPSHQYEVERECQKPRRQSVL